MSTGKVILGVAAGLTAGAILGVLFAPARGSITRKRVSQKATNYADDVKEKFSEYVDAIGDTYTSLKGGAREWAGRGKVKADSALADNGNSER